MLSEKPWTIERVAMMFLTMFLCLCLFVIVLKTAGLEGIGENAPAYPLVLLFSTQTAIISATSFVIWWNQMGWKNAFGFSRWSINRSLFWGVVTTIIFLPLGGILKWASVYAYHLVTGGVPVEQEAVQIFVRLHNPFNLVAFVVFSVVMAPLAEEICFRGILYPAIKRLGFPKLGLLISAGLFGLIHGSWPVFVPLSVFGACLVLLYEHTDNLLATVTAHAMFNAINLVQLAFMARSSHALEGWSFWLGS